MRDHQASSVILQCPRGGRFFRDSLSVGPALEGVEAYTSRRSLPNRLARIRRG
jgi:hypothetical protein